MGGPEKIPVARIGRTVGLRGDLRLNLLTDFPEQFVSGARFFSDRGDLTIRRYDADRGVVRFVGYDDVDAARSLTNAYLYTTKEAGEAACRLEEGEYFWYQIIGLEVIDDGEPLGRVERIERLAGTDYLVVATRKEWVEAGAASRFLIPYVDRYVVGVDTEAGEIRTRDAAAILDAS